MMAAGLSRWGKLWLEVRLMATGLALWGMVCVLAVMQKLGTWRVY